MTVTVRPLNPGEYPQPIPFVPGQQSYGGGCEHWHRPHFPCGNSAGYMVGDKRLCWSHTAREIRALMFKRVPIAIQEADAA